MNRYPKIKEVYNPNQTIALLVSGDELLTDVLTRFVEKPHIRGIFVSSKDGRYIGMIKRDDLLNWSKVKLGDVGGMEDYLLKFSKETKAKDIVRAGSEGAVVKEDDDILTALRLMFSRSLTDLPVLDKNNRIIGDVTIPELLAKVLKVVGN